MRYIRFKLKREADTPAVRRNAPLWLRTSTLGVHHAWNLFVMAENLFIILYHSFFQFFRSYSHLFLYHLAICPIIGHENCFVISNVLFKKQGVLSRQLRTRLGFMG